LRKLLLAYRLLHIKDPYKEITVGLDGRDEELCKPLLQLFYTLEATEQTRTEIEKTLQYFLDIKNNRKGDSLEGSVYPIVVDALSTLGEDHVPLTDYDDEDEPERLKSISTTELWEKITSSLYGHFDQDKDGVIREPNTYYFDEFGRKYRNSVMAIIRDKFGAEKDHTRKGNNLIFDLDRLDKMRRIYENDGKIKTKAYECDSVTHRDDLGRDGDPGESPTNDENERENEREKGDSTPTIPSVDEHSESLSHSADNISLNHQTIRKKCPYCDYEEDPFFLKVHVKMGHEGSL
jgi:hypothetical protein